MKSKEEKNVSDATFSVELLANYCDMLLRKTPLSKKLSSDEVEAKLRDVLLVLKYVQNKDVFMRSVPLLTIFIHPSKFKCFSFYCKKKKETS